MEKKQTIAKFFGRTLCNKPEIGHKTFPFRPNKKIRLAKILLVLIIL